MMAEHLAPPAARDHARISRAREVLLLLFGALILGLGYAIVWQAYLPTWQQLYAGRDWLVFAAPIGWLVAGLLLSAALAFRRCTETLLLPVAWLLLGIGLLFLLRLAGGTAAFNEDLAVIRLDSYHNQLTSAVVGWLVLLGIILFWRDYRALSRYKYLVAAAAVLLLLATTLLGSAKHGQQIVLDLKFVTFQPHELVKVLLVIFMAAYLVEKRELLALAAGKFGLLTVRDFRYMGPLIALWLLVMAIIFKHDDLGAAMLLFGSFLAMLYLGTDRKIYVIIGLALFVLGGVAAYTFSARVQSRVAIWQNPWTDPTDRGYQITQALMALGNGRVVGAGLAGGYPERIPAVHTDMIFAAMSEDLGLLGAVVIIGLYLVLIGRIFQVAFRAPDAFGRMLAAGLAVTIAVQTWVILAGVTKLIPLTGITLPFMSYGGTSLMVNMILLGIVFNIAQARSRHTS